MAPTCFGPDPDYAPCANGGRTAQLQRIGEPDYKGAAIALNAAAAAGRSSEFYAFATWSGREAVADGLYRKADWVPRNVSYVHPDGFFPTEESELNDLSSVLGLRGEWGEWWADLSLGLGKGEFRFSAANSINPSYAAEYLSRNPGATPDAIVGNSGPANVFSGALALRQIDVNADAARDLSLGSTPAHVALGGAWRRESFWMTAGEQASYACGPSSSPGSFPAAHEQNADGSAFASCGIQGFPGYSPASAETSERSRNSFGAYVDMEVEPARVFTLGAALRFENYSDAGNSLTGKVSGRIELGESGAALRTAVSTGFRAPRLPHRGFNTVIFQGGGGGLTSTGFLPEGDPLACADFDACSLAHETSRSFTGGFVYSNDSGLLFTADYYRVSVADAIVLTQGLGPDHGLRAGAQFQGRPVDGVSFWTNAVDTRTKGIDVVATWRARGMSWGAVDLTASLHRNETEITNNRNPAFVRETQTMLLTENQPKQRIGAGVDVRSARGIGARFRLNHVGSVMSPFIFEEPVEIDAAGHRRRRAQHRGRRPSPLGSGSQQPLRQAPQQAAGRSRGPAVGVRLPGRVALRTLRTGLLLARGPGDVARSRLAAQLPPAPVLPGNDSATSSPAAGAPPPPPPRTAAPRACRSWAGPSGWPAARSRPRPRPSPCREPAASFLPTPRPRTSPRLRRRRAGYG